MYTTKKIKKEYNYTPSKLMVVAHPDDETIFGGAQLLTEPNTWQVIVITNGMGGEEKNKGRPHQRRRLRGRPSLAKGGAAGGRAAAADEQRLRAGRRAAVAARAAGFKDL